MGGTRIVTGIFLQVRLTSTRLARKALLQLPSGTVIEYAMRALRHVPANIYSLLTDAQSAPGLLKYAEKEGFDVFIGPTDDVLKRYCLAAHHFHVTRVVRATGDNPLVSPILAEKIIKIHTERKGDLSHFIGIPLGTGVEVVEADALFQSEKEATDPFEREHITTHIYRNRHRFNVIEEDPPPSCYMPELRVTLDTSEDYVYIRSITNNLKEYNPIETEHIIHWQKQIGEKRNKKKETYSQKKILLVPSLKTKGGTGHLKRCLSLLRDLTHDAYLYIPEERQDVLSLLSAYKERVRSSLSNPGGWDMIVLDQQWTTRQQLKEFFSYGIIVAIDEGGTARAFIPYLIDTFLSIPPARGKTGPNIITSSIPEVNGRRRSLRFPFQKILITFGGEDPFDLSTVLLHTLLKEKLYKPEMITVVRGPFFRQKAWPEGINIVEDPPHMVSLYKEHDLVFTHFGLTCFEALAAGVPVILLNPSLYHKKLSEYHEIPHCGVKKPDKKKLKKLLSNKETFLHLLKNSRFLSHDNILTPGWIIKHFDLSGNLNCPLCKTMLNPVLARFTEKTYFQCKQCGIIYSFFFEKNENKYNKNYFFSEYKKQYGKTYLEDFKTIEQSGRRRIQSLKKLLPVKEGPTLLDIGCAYGPFLAAAEKGGFRCEGIDICPDAVMYVKNNLHLNCICCDFTDPTANIHQHNHVYDAVTMWFVIEHFNNTSDVLTKVNRLLKKGGIFAFSTPSASGISARRNMTSFLEQSPQDHYTIWKPSAVKKTLKRYGFIVRTINITGHHPERFYCMKDIEKKQKKIINTCMEVVSRVFSLGDTFEVYAEKVREVV
jgi:spore coat polysaccharide biosynthesis protein SpsF (cytidylyltransferase family)/2-polyprenyl-3-methyl-5-hydroxy-6-metoxy-1,4-benzoquinol methylase